MSCGARKLLILSQFYRPEPIGTARYATDLAAWTARRGFSVTVLTARPNYPSFRIQDGFENGERDDEVVDGVRVLRSPAPLPRSGTAFRRALFEACLFLRIGRRLLRNPELRAARVVSFSPSVLSALVGSFARPRGGRHVAIVHDIQSGLAAGLGLVRSRALFRVMRGLERRALNRADHVVVISGRMRNGIRELGVRTDVSVLPLWVDTARIVPSDREPDSRPTLLYSGNLGRKQGLESVLELAERLLRARPEIAVVVRGEGSQENRLRRLARERDLRNVEFRPLVPDERLGESLTAGDLHVVPQLPEGAEFAVPSKVYAIMAAGRPFVCTADPGSTLWELMEEAQACRCSPPGDPGALTRDVIELLDDPEQRRAMGARGRRYVERVAERERVLPALLRIVEGDGLAP